MSDQFDAIRRDAARKTLEDAASAEDEQTARILEMCVDDLIRPLNAAERELLEESFTCPGCGHLVDTPNHQLGCNYPTKYDDHPEG